MRTRAYVSLAARTCVLVYRCARTHAYVSLAARTCVLVYRCALYWRSGVRVYWCSGVFVYWCTGVLYTRVLTVPMGVVMGIPMHFGFQDYPLFCLFRFFSKMPQKTNSARSSRITPHDLHPGSQRWGVGMGFEYVGLTLFTVASLMGGQSRAFFSC